MNSNRKAELLKKKALDALLEMMGDPEYATQQHHSDPGYTTQNGKSYGKGTETEGGVSVTIPPEDLHVSAVTPDPKLAPPNGIEDATFFKESDPEMRPVEDETEGHEFFKESVPDFEMVRAASGRPAYVAKKAHPDFALQDVTRVLSRYGFTYMGGYRFKRNQDEYIVVDPVSERFSHYSRSHKDFEGALNQLDQQLVAHDSEVASGSELGSNPLLKEAVAGPQFLFHGTNDTALAGILKQGMPAPNYWGTAEMADYFSKGASEDEGTPVILRVPFNRFDVSKLAIDDVAVAEPITEVLGHGDEELYALWQEVPGDGTWQDSFRIYQSVKYLAPMKVTQADIWKGKTAKTAGERVTDPGTYDEKKESEIRQIAKETAQYGEEGEPTFDPKGDYLCKDCFYLMDGACAFVEGKVSAADGTCRYWKAKDGSTPVPLERKYDKEEAGYTERPNGEGFGCHRCHYGAEAKKEDSEGRKLWCERFGTHVRKVACCAKNEGPNDIVFDAEGQIAKDAGFVPLAALDKTAASKLYHVTHTSKVPSIQAKGIMPLQESNWVKGDSKDRYGEGEIFAFNDPRDAVRWAGKMDWEFNQGMGTGKISIVIFKPGKEEWKVDDADPMSQAAAKGQWLKAHGVIKPEQIIKVVPVNGDMTRAVVQGKPLKLGAEEEKISATKSYGTGTPIGGTPNATEPDPEDEDRLAQTNAQDEASLSKSASVALSLDSLSFTAATYRAVSLEDTGWFSKSARPLRQKLELLQKQFKLTAKQVEFCAAADPTSDQYVAWLAKWSSAGRLRLPEQSEAIKKDLQTFTELQRSPNFTHSKDIQQYDPKKLHAVAAVEFKETPRMLPPRDDMRTHIDQEAQAEAMEGVMDGVKQPLNKKPAQPKQIDPRINANPNNALLMSDPLLQQQMIAGFEDREVYDEEFDKPRFNSSYKKEWLRRIEEEAPQAKSLNDTWFILPSGKQIRLSDHTDVQHFMPEGPTKSQVVDWGRGSEYPKNVAIRYLGLIRYKRNPTYRETTHFLELPPGSVTPRQRNFIEKLLRDAKASDEKIMIERQSGKSGWAEYDGTQSVADLWAFVDGKRGGRPKNAAGEIIPAPIQPEVIPKRTGNWKLYAWPEGSGIQFGQYGEIKRPVPKGQIWYVGEKAKALPIVNDNWGPLTHEQENRLLSVGALNIGGFHIRLTNADYNKEYKVPPRKSSLLKKADERDEQTEEFLQAIERDMQQAQTAFMKEPYILQEAQDQGVSVEQLWNEIGEEYANEYFAAASNRDPDDWRAHS